MKTHLLVGAALAMSVFNVAAQELPSDELTPRQIRQAAQALEHDFIREADVMWEKRIWREIDLRQKRNHAFLNEKEPFINILTDAGKNGNITYYSSLDDEFKTPLSKEDFCAMLVSVDTVAIIDPVTMDEIYQVVQNDFDPKNVKKFRVKEVWYFDEESGRMGQRILGIAPIVQRFDENGNFLNEGVMFWAYYPHIRAILARKEAYNEHNEAIRMSWEDVFEARFFASRILKEGNTFDRRIQDYKAGIDALVESDNITASMFNFEHDLWEY